MATVNVIDSDLRRDEARISFILAGGPPPEVFPGTGPRRLPIAAGIAAALLALAAGMAGLAWRHLHREETAPAAPAWTLPAPPPSAVVPVSPMAAPAIPPPEAVSRPLARPAPVAPPLGPPVARRTRPPARARAAARLAHRHAASRPAEPRQTTRPIEAPPAASASRWIAEPLYGDALRRAQEADARRAAELNRAELRRLPRSPDE